MYIFNIMIIIKFQPRKFVFSHNSRNLSSTQKVKAVVLHLTGKDAPNHTVTQIM